MGMQLGSAEDKHTFISQWVFIVKPGARCIDRVWFVYIELIIYSIFP